VPPPTRRKSPTASQHGGLITEEILGVGLKTGNQYNFGEGGAERITPVNSSGSAGQGNSFNANFYITGVGNIMDMEVKLKPMVMRWFKEATSMRGIV